MNNLTSSQLPSELALRVENISKAYQLFNSPQAKTKELIVANLPKWMQIRSEGSRAEQFWAVRDISFDLPRGEAIGIIGVNGSGKSTLLQMIVGITRPTSGRVYVRGRVGSLLELGSGFNPNYTGRENVYLNGSILGFSRLEMAELMPTIEEFAEIGEFIDQPVKNYSSGMFVRLAFAVQACVEPDILIVDEALAVGDVFFQQKCHTYIEKLLKQGTAVLIVSHNMQAIAKYSNRVMLLNKGQTKYLGQPILAINQYYSIMEKEKLDSPQKINGTPPLILPNEKPQPTKSSKNIFGNFKDWRIDEDVFVDVTEIEQVGMVDKARILQYALLDDKGIPCNTFMQGQNAHIYYDVEILSDIEMPYSGFAIYTTDNILVHSRNTLNLGIEGPNTMQTGAKLRFYHRFTLAIEPKSYLLSLGFGTINKQDYYKLIHPPFAPIGLYNTVLCRLFNFTSLSVIVQSNCTQPFHGLVALDGDMGFQDIQNT